MHYDVIVVGAGSMGMSTGYYLAKSGRRTLLIDSFKPPHNRGSHHGDTRIIRYALGHGEQYVPLALKAQELWNEVEELTGKQLFLETGVLTVGKKESTFIQNIIEHANRLSLSLEVLSSSEVENRWPGMSLPNDFVGCLEPTAGVLKSESCIEAYEQLAKMSKATIVTNRKVIDMTVKEKIVTLKTEDQMYTADSIVIAAGGWSKELLAMLGLDLPLSPVRKTFSWFDAPQNQYDRKVFPAFIFDTDQGIYYGFPSIDGAGIKVGRHDGGTEIDPNETLHSFGNEACDEDDVTQFLDTYMPNHLLFKEGKTCMYTLTPDDDFIIDLHPTYSNVAIAAGFSGQGFKFSSAIGHILSELVIAGSSEQDISAFSINRFRDC